MKGQKSSLPDKRLLNAIAVLSLAALLLSAYVFWTTTRGSNLAGCGEGSSCEEVLQTQWNSVLGLPVSLGAIFVYAAIFVTSRRLFRKSTLFDWRVLLFLSVLAAGSALWFTGLQLFLIRSLCYFCLVIHLCGLSVLAITLWNISKNKPEKNVKSKENMPAISFKSVAASGFVGLVGAVFLAVVQMVFKGNIVPAEPVMPTELPQSSEKREASPNEEVRKREISFLNGNIRLKLGDYPIIGSAEAPKMVGLFLDYTCPACRSLHPQVSKMVEASANQFAVVVLPMPLDASCNPIVEQTSYQHRDACNYWLIALALWRVSKEAFHSWDEFMFQSEYPPPLEDARNFAAALVGSEALETLLNDPQNPDLIHYSIQIFNSPLFTRRFLPTLMTPQRYISGMPSEEELQQLLGSL